MINNKRNNNKKRGATRQNKSKGGNQRAFVAQSVRSRTTAPRINYKKDGSMCVVSRTERLGAVLGSTLLASTAYDINPGIQRSFPWVAAVANRFESYNFRSLHYEFRTKCATTHAGNVIMAIDFDPADATPIDATQAEDYDGAISMAPWQNGTCRASGGNLHKRKTYFTKSTASTSSLYDVGKFHIFTEGMVDASLIGVLYVTYTVEFMTPQLKTSPLSPVVALNGGSVTSAGAVSNAYPLGADAVNDPDNVGIQVTEGSTNSQLEIQEPGEYLLSLQSIGTSLSSWAFANLAGGATALLLSAVTSASGSLVESVYRLSVPVASALIGLSIPTGTVTSSILRIAMDPAGSLEALEARAQLRKVRAGYRVHLTKGCALAHLIEHFKQPSKTEFLRLDQLQLVDGDWDVSSEGGEFSR
jgi:hypothetical protein